MSDTIEAKHTAANVIAENEAREKTQRKRALRVLGSIALFILGYASFCHPRYQQVRVSPARNVDVISLSEESSLNKMFGAKGNWAGPALVVHYYSNSTDKQSQGYERLELFEWARPEADRRGLNAIVLWRTEPVVSRWLPFVRGDASVFQKTADGAWPSRDIATPRMTSRNSPLSHRVVHLANGDSVEWQATLPAVVGDNPPGVLVEFYAFTTTTDTAVLRGKARALLPLVVPEVEARQPAFIVVRAVDLPAARRVGTYRLNNLNTVFEKRGDGLWHEIDGPARGELP